MPVVPTPLGVDVPGVLEVPDLLVPFLLPERVRLLVVERLPVVPVERVPVVPDGVHGS